MMGEFSFSSFATVGDDAPSRATEEDSAFDALYRRFHPRLSRYAVRRLADAAAAEDVAQESLVRAWQRRDRFMSDEDLAPWLWRVARNLCVDVVRGRRHLVLVDAVPEQADYTKEVHGSVEADEERRSVRVAFGTLGRRHREILYLRDIKGLGYEELALHLGVSEQNARSVVCRARARLRHAFESVVGAALAALAWVRAKIASRIESFQPVAAAAMHVLVVIVVSATAAIGGTDGPIVRTSIMGNGTHAEVTSGDPGGDFLAQQRPLPNDADGARDGLVHLRVDRKSGSAALGVGVPLGPEQEEYVWARVWREHEDDDPSHTLSTVDEAGETVCGTQRSACGGADEALADSLDRP